MSSARKGSLALQNRRRRFNNAENQYLEIEYQKKGGEWSQAYRRKLASMLSVSETKIYKWNWDRRAKEARGQV